MAEIRQFNRITFVASGTLQYRDTTFNCRIENMSMAGALISISNTTTTDFRPGNVCVLKLYDELEGRHLAIEVLVAHQAFAYVGLRFLRLDVDTQVSLEIIMARGTMGMEDTALSMSSFHRTFSGEN